jgi:hypothetical protein
MPTIPRRSLWILVICQMAIAAACHAYTISGPIEALLPTEAEMPTFRLKSQVPSQWVISPKQLISGIRQTWVSRSRPDEELMVDVCLLDGAQAANRCTHLTRMETSALLAWGSYRGQFLGDKLWLGTNSFGNAAFQFLKYNVAAKVAMIRCEPGQIKLMETVAQQVLKKIEAKKSPKPTEEYARFLKEQLSQEDFDKIVSEAATLVLRGWRLERSADALWLTDETGRYQLGRQREWRREDGAIIGISICRFANAQDTQRAAVLRKNETHGYFVGGDLQSPKIPPDINHFESVASVIFAKGPWTVHVYQYNKRQTDTKLFQALVARVARNL